jgi:hypothetical protein
MRLKIVFLTVAVLTSTTHVLAQSQQKDPQYYHFLMANCPGKKLEVKLKNGQKVSGICEAQLVDRVQILRAGVTHDIPYTNIAKMNVKRSCLSKCFGQVKDAMAAPGFYIYIIAVGLTSDDDFPW